jgi:Ca2+/H+ antiporter, TMEM165/GDT1 family
MRHSRLIIFAGAFVALALMSLLSALLGHILPHLLPRRYTTIAAALLFLVFGAKMLKEGIEMEGGTSQIEEEMQQVQKEVESVEATPDIELGLTTPQTLSTPQLNGRPLSRPVSPNPSSAKRRSSEANASLSSAPREAANKVVEGLRNLSHLLFSPIFVQAFVLTFLAEWGDRSQITTIALGAAHNVWIVTIGTILGHSLCTAGAVLGGRWLATKISVKNGALALALLFTRRHSSAQ